MKQIVETFVTIMLITVIVIVASQIIMVQVQISKAKELHATSIAQIEASNFNKETIAEIKEDLTNNADSNFDLFNEDGEGNDGKEVLMVTEVTTPQKKCDNCMSVFSDVASSRCPSCGTGNLYTYKSDRYAIIELNYTVQIPLLKIQQDGVLTGYAR